MLDHVCRFSRREDEEAQLKIYDDFIGSDSKLGFADVIWNIGKGTFAEE